MQNKRAVERYAVFGTATRVFPTGCAVYLKLARPPEGTEAEWVFALLQDLVMEHPAVQDIKLTRQEHS